MPGTAIHTIEIEMATLRPLRLDDAEALFPLLSDPDTMRYFGKPHESLAETHEFLADLAVGQGGDKWHRLWAILPDGEGDCRGWIALMNRIPGQDNCELGFLLHPDWRGRGIARAAARAALEYAFGGWGIHRVYALVVPANEPSVRLIEALGFRPEGRLRESFRRDGAYHDDRLYGLLAHEFGQD